MFDTDDAEMVGKHNWSALISHRGGKANAIAVRRVNAGGYHYLHREITGASPEQFVDHRDHNTTNNRKANIRPCTPHQNVMNQSAQKGRRSRFKGVSFDKERGHWRAYIWFRGKREYCGRHATEEEAAEAYDKAALRLYGEFAATNAALGMFTAP